MQHGSYCEGEGGGGSRELICLTEGRSSSSTDVVLVRVVLHIGKGGGKLNTRAC